MSYEFARGWRAIVAALSLILCPAAASAYDPGSSYVHTVGNYVYRIEVNGSVATGNASIVDIKPGYVPSGEITIPGSVTIDGTKYTVTSIGENYNSLYWFDYEPVFKDFTEITRVNISSPLKSMGRREFEGCNGINEFHVNAASTYFKDIDGVLLSRESETVKWTLFRMPPARPKTRYTVPEEVGYIGDFAFMGNKTIKTLVLSGGQMFTTNGLWAWGNSGISEVNVDATHNYVSVDGIIYNTSKQTIVACPPALKLDRFAVPSTVKAIGNGAFCCSAIPEIVLHDKADIGYYTFAGSKIKSLSISNTALNGSEALCYGCTELTSVAITGSKSATAYIDKRMFSGCSKLTDVAIQPQHIALGARAFYGCSALKAFSLAYVDDMTGLDRQNDGEQFAYSGLESLNWPSKITEIPTGCFRGCANLAKVNLDPMGKGTLKKIGSYAFADCTALPAIDLAQVTYIAAQAFSGNTSLRSIVFPENADGEEISVPSGITFTDDVKVYVGSNAFYWAVVSWGDLVNSNAGEAIFISSSVTDNIPSYWKKAYVPYLATENYDRPYTQHGPVVEMFSVKISDSNAITATPNPDLTDIDFKITKTQHETNNTGTGVRVFYTVDGVAMSTFYLRSAFSGITDADTGAPAIEAVYTPDGILRGTSVEDAPAGILIVKYTDGTTRKLVNKPSAAVL